MGKTIMALIGVILGFLLGEGSRYIRFKCELGRLKNAIKKELEFNLNLLPYRRNQINDIIKELKNERTLMIFSIKFMYIGYKGSIEKLYPYYSSNERICLHDIYERLMITDELISQYDSDIKASFSIMKDPYYTYVNLFSDALTKLDLVEETIRNFLKGDFKNIF